MKVFKVTLFVAEYKQSVSDTTKLEIAKFVHEEVRTVVARDGVSALALIDFAGYMQTHGVDDSAKVRYCLEELELKGL